MSSIIATVYQMIQENQALRAATAFGECVEAINKDTTSEKYAARCNTLLATYPFYQHGLNRLTNYGNRPLCQAAKVGNDVFIRDIVASGGSELLDQENAAGCTPLYLSICSKEFSTAKTLIELGAKVNQLVTIRLSTTPMVTMAALINQFLPMGDSWTDMTLEHPPVSYLWLAIQDNEKSCTALEIDFIKFLLKHDATATPELSERGKGILAIATKELNAQKVMVLLKIHAVLQQKQLDKNIKETHWHKKLSKTIADYV